PPVWTYCPYTTFFRSLQGVEAIGDGVDRVDRLDVRVGGEEFGEMRTELADADDPQRERHTSSLKLIGAVERYGRSARDGKPNQIRRQRPSRNTSRQGGTSSPRAAIRRRSRRRLTSIPVMPSSRIGICTAKAIRKASRS